MAVKKHALKEISNRSATFHFAIDAKYEAGMVLCGSEVKSIRAGGVSFNDSFCVIHEGEVFVRSLHINEYKHGNSFNHNPTQERKLLLNRKEIKKLEAKVKEKGFTIVPLRIFFNEKHFAKLEIGVGRGKKEFDKRETIKNRDIDKDIKRYLAK